jgi:hypothetical protein
VGLFASITGKKMVAIPKNTGTNAAIIAIDVAPIKK